MRGVVDLERIVVLNGPNLNLLGERDTTLYGASTLDEINAELSRVASGLGVEVEFYQSNHEGDLIDRIHEERKRADGLIINPGALTHYSYSLRDAVDAVRLPTVEVHISNIYEREEWRRHSVLTPVAWKVIAGRGPRGYEDALVALVEHLRSETR